MESTGLDNEFLSTRYGALRVAHFVLCILCLILDEMATCWQTGMYETVCSYGLIFSILVLIMFCVQFHHTLENYINLPLSLMINEVILTVLFLIAGIVALMNLCGGSYKIFGIFKGIFAIITAVTFGAASRLSYDWFATGSPALTV